MDIFGTRNPAMDAKTTDGKELDWITINGAHIPVKEGETHESAAKKFIEKKQAEKRGEKKNSYHVGVRYEADYYPTNVKTRRQPADFKGDTFNDAKNLSLKIRAHGFKLEKMDDNKAFIEDKKGEKHIITFKTNNNGSVTVTKTEPYKAHEASKSSQRTKQAEKPKQKQDVNVALAKANDKLNKTRAEIKRIRAKLDNPNLSHSQYTNLNDKLEAARKKNDAAFKEFEELNQKQKNAGAAWAFTG